MKYMLFLCVDLDVKVDKEKPIGGMARRGARHTARRRSPATGERRDDGEAIEAAAKHPVAEFGTVEVRPFWQG